MCGIAGVHLKNPEFVKSHQALETFINALFLGIEARGRRATGLVAVKAGGHVGTFEKADITAKDFIEVRDPLPEGVRTILCHTRYDTKGDPKDNRNNHPVLYGSTFAIHNGAIFNDDKLFEESGLKRNAEVDSEVISALLDKEGLEKAQAVLEKFRGHVAIAAINPVNFPDRLILAKGEHSPLVAIENDNFIVWASLESAIKEAWGLVLGTPPTFKKYHRFKEGEYWVVQGDQVEKGEYKVNKDHPKPKQQTVDHSGRQHHCNDGGHSDYGWGKDWSDDDWPSETRSARNDYTTPWTKLNLRKEVEALRAAGRGQARIMDVHEVDPKEVKGSIIWQRCTGCNTTVLNEDVRATYSWGRMCIDCYEVKISTTKQKYENPATVLTDNEKRLLNNWSVLESTAHTRALAEVASRTELSVDLIEWLIFRVPETYTERHKKLNDLAGALDDLYQDALHAQFQSVGINDVSDPKQTIDRKKKEEPRHPLAALPPGASDRVYTGCSKHGRAYPEGASCSECSRSSTPFTASAPPTTYCQTCGNKKPKRVQKGRIRIGRFVWCNKHFEECNNPDCPLVGVERKDEDGNKKKFGLAVATTPDGTRLCHFCVRGEKGTLFDGQHETRGIEVVRLA